jgi:hypothetical protein
MCSHERVRHAEHGGDPGVLVLPGGECTNGLIQHIHAWGDMPTVVSNLERKGLQGVSRPLSLSWDTERCEEDSWDWA